MKREDWAERLNNFLDEDHPFDWANCNCALFAADGVEAQTGEDFAASYRGPKTKRGIITRLIRVCGGDVETAATQELGEPISNILMARRGDVVSYDFGEGPALGLCNGSSGVFVSELEGKVLVPLRMCSKAWRVV